RSARPDYSTVADKLNCPYCGHTAEHSEFLTPEQRARVMAAAEALAAQWAHQQLHEMLDGVFGSGRRRPRSRASEFGMSLELGYTPGSPPPLRVLPEVIEDQVRRTISCAGCATDDAVYGACAFCPVCGPRPALDTVREAITAARLTLALEDGLDADQRESLRASGVLERFAVDALTSTVSLFEVFMRDRFTRRRRCGVARPGQRWWRLPAPGSHGGTLAQARWS
ncbi:MAG: hypothetical protein K2Q09_11600, partial [Phycisphaerales bacterium]|nr:hypothetical protein [Phycisphaerales bacterium]